jgi:hypothetical protein
VAVRDAWFVEMGGMPPGNKRESEEGWRGWWGCMV